MGLIEKFSENPVIIVISFFLVLFLIKELYNLYKWYKEKADDYHKSKSDDEAFHKQVCEIQCTSERHTETLIGINKSLDKINNRLDSIEESNTEAIKAAEIERQQDIVINGRATLYHLYEDLKDKDTLTLSEYETFKTIAERYMSAGGNGAFRDKIIPEIMNKPLED